MGTNAGSGEAQYMQQQSQIYVFSTILANKGADAVMRGDYPSIIDFHRAQPNTKKYLEVLRTILTYPDSTVSLQSYEQFIVKLVVYVIMCIH